ncbi:MAG: endonuclease/exonuclease/phosphatase family protein, partial [bacterium]
MKWFRYILATVLCLSLSPNTGAYRSDSTSRTLRLLTINVWSGLDYEGSLKMGEYEPKKIRERRYRALVAQIKQLDPDIIGLQEANKLPDYAERLAGDIGYRAFYHVGVGGLRLGPVGLPWNLREGDAILAKKNLQPESAGRKQLSGGYVGDWATFHFSDATQVIAVKVTVLDSPLYVFVTHWHASLLGTPKILRKARRSVETGESSQKNYEEAMAEISQGVQWRMAESKKTLAFIENIARNHPVILMGDF